MLGAAAEDLYALEDYAPAATAGRTLIARYPTAEPALRRTAWTVVAHSSFELADFQAAEPAYAEVLALTPAEDEDATSARRQSRSVDLQAGRAGQRGAGLSGGRGPFHAHRGARADVVDSPGRGVRRGGGAHEASGLDGGRRGARRFSRRVPRSRAERAKRRSSSRSSIARTAKPRSRPPSTSAWPRKLPIRS